MGYSTPPGYQPEPPHAPGVSRLSPAWRPRPSARGDTGLVRPIAGAEPRLVGELIGEGGELPAEFAGNENPADLRHLLELGVGVSALDARGDGYLGVATASTVLHVAAWRAPHEALKLLIERAVPIDAADGRGRTPLALAAKMCVASYWVYRRSPESVAAQLRGGV